MSGLEGKIRYRLEKGDEVADIARQLGCELAVVENCASRFGQRTYLNRQGHQIFETWTGSPAPVPTGKCVAWIVVEGKAQQCGAKCKGQRCKDHPITIARTIHIGARTGGGLAA